MSKNLSVYGALTDVKIKERQELEEQIKQLKLAIKHTQEEALKAEKKEQDFRREVYVVSKVQKRKGEENQHMQREIQEIKELLPLLTQAIQEAKARVIVLAKNIEEEVKIEEHLFNTVVPKINSAITETQYEKDRLATQIAKQIRRKQRLEEDVVKLVVESNQLYVRTEKNLNYKQPLLMH